MKKWNITSIPEAPLVLLQYPTRIITILTSTGIDCLGCFELHINGIIQFVLLCIWLTSLDIVFLDLFIFLLHAIVHPFPLLYKILCYIPLFIHSTVYGQFYNIWFLAAMKSAAVNILIHIFRYIHTCVHIHTHALTHISAGYVPKSRIARSPGMGMFSFGWYCHRFLKVVVIIYTSYSNIWKFWLPYPHQLLNFSLFFTLAIHSCRCVVISHHSFNLNFSEDWWNWGTFVCSGHLDISFVNCFFMSFAHFSIQLIF